MEKDDLVLVTGAGGFIGGHLVRDLRERGYKKIRAADIKPLHEWHQRSDDVDNLRADLNLREAAFAAVKGARYVFNLACNMGGMGFIEHNKAECMLNVLSSTHLLLAAKEHRAERYFYSSTACVYNINKQRDPNVTALKEEDAYPADAEDGYGWEKLFTERMCRHFQEDYGLPARIARIHNAYGPCGTYDGGREKAPAAICRKVAQAKISGRHDIEIWGDGRQTRSFMYVDDCIHGIKAIMQSEAAEPLNLGSSQLATINQLVSIAEEIADVKLQRHYKLDAPQGVRGRNSDNHKIRALLGWEPSTPLADGLARTYEWIYDCMLRRQAA